MSMQMQMLWAALCWPAPAEGAPAVDLQGPACWALQFTPRVARCGEALRLELAASQRLFGGQVALLSRLANEGRQLGASGVAWASTASAAQALARQHAQAAWADGGEGAGPDPSRVPGLQQPLADALDPLPLETLDGLRPHADTLHLMGCHCLGEVRRLPRAGLARRFEAGLLAALDQVYGTLPEAHTWLTLPETFSARLELAFRVEQAPALLAGAQRLLLQLCGWLQARHAGVLAFTLAWEHDSMRARDVAPGGALTVRTAQPARQAEHLARLLAEHLARVTLAAPAAALRLTADEVQALAPPSGQLWPDARQQARALDEVLEQVAARLGAERVCRPRACEDHRPEWMQGWQPLGQPLPRSGARLPTLPQPAFLLPAPQRLGLRQHRPVHQGQPLLLLLGPQRVEGGWWHRSTAPLPPGAEATAPEGATGVVVSHAVARDYWVAWSERAGVLWVFQTRLEGEAGEAWFLHGHFA